jgi:hypothetical protein
MAGEVTPVSERLPVGTAWLSAQERVYMNIFEMFIEKTWRLEHCL